MNDPKLDSPVIIVSGLPRSGTSMLMQMLAAAGVPILSDGTRIADESNPRGYLELELVKRLPVDSSWLYQAAGKAVKIIVQLLPFLPKDLKVQVVFIDRPVSEVVQSQNAMLERLGVKPAADSQVLKQTFEKQREAGIQFLRQRPNTELLIVSQKDLIALDKGVVEQIAQFLGRDDLNFDAMLTAIDPTLNRVKS